MVVRFHFMAGMTMVMAAVFLSMVVIMRKLGIVVDDGVAVFVTVDMAVSMPMDKVSMHVLVAVPVGMLVVM